MRPTPILFIIFLLFSFSSHAQNVDSYVKKDFLILLSTKSYAAALTMAKKVATAEKIKLDLRGLTENKEAGLTLSKEECEKAEETYPAYYARGRYDDGVYISVEYSDAYAAFAKGYYIVMAASGSKEDKDVKNIYNKIKRSYKDAYFKSSKVYMGCMH